MTDIIVKLAQRQAECDALKAENSRLEDYYEYERMQKIDPYQDQSYSFICIVRRALKVKVKP